MFDDLRGFIKKAEEIGEYKLVEGADWNLEIGVLGEILADTPNAPLLLFDKIKGYKPGYRVASNLAVTDRRIALALGLPEKLKRVDLVKALRDKLRDVKLIPPVEVKDAPVKENVLTGDDIDLFKFPVPKWHELDGGRYIGTGDLAITRDPEEGWVNFGAYRTQIHDKSTATISMGRDHMGFIMAKKYWDKGLPCPAAVSCGQEPVLFFSSSSDLPWGVSEYDYAGGFKGKPIEVTRGVFTDLPIPASAEIVLEGEIVPPDVETRPEGPFGEWRGYYAGGSRGRVPKLVPAFKVKAILHRDNPIIQGAPPSRPHPAIYSIGRHYQKAAILWNELDRQIPGVKGVWMVAEAGVHCMVVISLRQMFAGHAKQAAAVASACNDTARSCTWNIVVDDDIDPSSISELLWALGTRTDPAQIDVLRGCRTSRGLPIIPIEQLKSGVVHQNRGIVLACKPFNMINDFPPAVTINPEYMEKTRRKWVSLF